MTPIVLVHGGGFGASCWEPLLPHLEGPKLAIDLPGRGAHPLPLGEVTFEVCARSVEEDLDRAGIDEMVLVGHSLAGCSMPAMLDRLGDRVRHLVFLACTVPEDGTSCISTLDPEVRAMAEEGARADEMSTLAPEVARFMFGTDLDEEQFAWCLAQMVPEAPRLTSDPVDLGPLRRPVPRTWIRTRHDAVVPAAKQTRFAANVGDCPVVDLDAAHMSMISRPAETAALLRAIAARPGR